MDTNRRPNIADDLMDVIQMSKYLHRGEHLDFTTGFFRQRKSAALLMYQHQP